MQRIHHVSVLVRSIAESLPLDTDLLGLQADPPVDWPELQVRAVFVRAGEDQLELLEPMTRESPLGKVLAKRGEGLLHVCLEVEDVEGALRQLEARGCNW